ncbi:hypothetical protein F183_A29410 [Bryobacterales bacterium F-183]|nr:hypothetical protein F183_A29410 [Bryobacterales bacterium F-183]
MTGRFLHPALLSLVILAATPVLADSTACAPCHANIAKTYANTGMAKAFYKPRPDSFPNPQPYFHPATRTWFDVTRRDDGNWYQSWWQIDHKQQPTNAGESRIDFIMGSGNHVRTYLHRSARGTLIELPLAWYSESGGKWALNPGFDRSDPPLGRKIGYDCMFCHNAYPAIPPGHDHTGAEPVFTGDLPQGIDCERCHGPGTRHIEAAKQPQPLLDQIRATIVNPAKLDSVRAMDVCMQCHLETTSRPLPNSIRRYDKHPFGYQPGQPFSAFQLSFDHAPGTGHDDKFEIVNSVYRLQKSKCYIASAGKLGCTTCHNPHDIQHGKPAEDAYNKTCAGCHAPATIKAQSHPQAGNCIGCHMPKRRSEDVVHAVMTDHLIQRQAPPNALAPIAEKHGPAYDYRGEVVPYGPKDDLYTAVAQVTHGSNLQKGIPQLQAEIARRKPEQPEFYMELGDALQRAGRSTEAIAAYRTAIAKKPRSAILYARLAMPQRALGRTQEPLASMQQAVTLAPQDPEIRYNLGLLQSDLGNKQAAIATFRKAIELDPLFSDAHASLGATLAQLGQPSDALAALQTALRLKPTSLLAHGQMAYLRAAQNDLETAAWHFERAAQTAVNHFAHAITLLRLDRIPAAQTLLEQSLKLDPKQPVAHELLGRLLAAAGDQTGAISHYKDALRLNPNFGQAHLSLGTLLLQQGNRIAAAAELRLAQNDPDPNVRQLAAQALQTIR